MLAAPFSTNTNESPPAANRGGESDVLIHSHSSAWQRAERRKLTVNLCLEHNTHTRKRIDRTLLPNNGRDPAAVQQFNDQVRLVIVTPNGAPGHYDAVVDGELMVRASRVPFCDAARVLLERGVDGNSWLVMRHAGSETDSLRGKVGVAAKLTVAEGERDSPRFRLWKAPHSREGSPYIAKNQKCDPGVAPTGNLATEAGR
jgi:hypothetical protein